MVDPESAVHAHDYREYWKSSAGAFVVDSMDLSNDSNAPRGEDTSTPTSHWVAPHVWWADTDDNIEVNLNSAISPLPPPWDNTRRPSSQAVVGNGPSPRLQHMHRDPRGIFGDLPNSSFNGALTDPVERELRRRSAAVQEREATTPVSSDPPKQKINEDGITFDVEQQVGEGAGVVTARTGTAVDVVDIGSWREECHRLQGELANLARQRDRWPVLWVLSAMCFTCCKLHPSSN